MDAATFFCTARAPACSKALSDCIQPAQDAHKWRDDGVAHCCTTRVRGDRTCHSGARGRCQRRRAVPELCTYTSAAALIPPSATRHAKEPASSICVVAEAHTAIVSDGATRMHAAHEPEGVHCASTSVTTAVTRQLCVCAMNTHYPSALVQRLCSRFAIPGSTLPPSLHRLCATRAPLRHPCATLAPPAHHPSNHRAHPRYPLQTTSLNRVCVTTILRARHHRTISMTNKTEKHPFRPTYGGHIPQASRWSTSC